MRVSASSSSDSDRLKFKCNAYKLISRMYSVITTSLDAKDPTSIVQDVLALYIKAGVRLDFAAIGQKRLKNSVVVDSSHAEGKC